MFATLRIVCKQKKKIEEELAETLQSNFYLSIPLSKGNIQVFIYFLVSLYHLP